METNLVKSRSAARSKKSRSVNHQGSDKGSGKGKSGVGNDDVKNTKRRTRNEIVGLSSVEPKVKKSRNSVVDGVASVSVQSDGPDLGQNLEKSNGLTGFSLTLGGSGHAIPRKPRGSVGSKSHVAKQSGSSSSVDQSGQMKSDLKDGTAVVLSVPQHAKKKRGQLIVDKGKSVDQTEMLESDLKDRKTDVPSIPQHAKKKRGQLIVDKGKAVGQTDVLESDLKDCETDVPSILQYAKKKTKQLISDEGNSVDHIAKLESDLKNRTTAIPRIPQHGKRRREQLIVDIPSIPQHAKKKRKQLITVRESSVDPTANLNSDWKDPTIAVLKKNIPQHYKETIEQLNIDKGDLVDQTAMLNYDLKDRTTAVLSVPQHAKKRRTVIIDEGNVGNASSRKGQHHGNKRKGLPLDSLGFPEKAQPAVSYHISDNFMDDEENRVQNAAMILVSGDTGSHTENLQASSECQRYNFKKEGSPPKRRHFYEVKYTGLNAWCFLNKRIKVFSPLDERWYHGILSDHNEESKLFCVNYDKKAEEWIDLRNERYMLLLLRSEVLDVEKPLVSTSSARDSETMMALLALSSVSGSKTQKTSVQSISKSKPSSRNIQNAARVSNVCLLEKESSGFCFPDSAKRLADEANGGELMLEHATRPKEFLAQLSLPVRSILKFPFGSYTSRFSCLSPLLQYGAMLIRWPRVYFEMIFVDNEAGLRYFLLEGSLNLVLAFVFVVLAVFCEANEQRESVESEIPVTLVRFKLSCAQDRSKHHVFSFYSFSKLKSRLFKEVARRKSLRDIIPSGLSRFDKEIRKKHPNYHVKHGMLPFTLCFSAAPPFFHGLHLKLLLQSSIACVRLRQHCCSIPQIELDKSNVNAKSSGAQRASGYNSALNDGTVFNTNTIGHNIFSTRNTRNWSSSPHRDDSLVCPGERTNVVHSGFGNGPSKPQTQVHYATPSGSSKFRSRHKPLRHNGRPFRKMRRPSEKRTSDDSKGFQRNLELLACKSNVLITIADRCLREFGARVAIELADQNEWRLSVKFSGSTKYSHKVDHVFQPRSTNRYTRAMMWKGGKDWALEFPDRSQWMLFKEMHEECYNRNICAASVKNIPIPGVRLVEKCEDNTEKLPFIRSPWYFRQTEDDIDMAMNPSKILYDMDSEDEQWILRNENSFQTQETCHVAITDDLFEKTMGTLEKVAYAQQRDHFTAAEIENFTVRVVPSEVIDSIYQHWQQKRKKIGRPLIRHLQPPLWERYQEKIQEWSQLMAQVKNTAACGSNTKAPPVEKPAMFAFCLKPHGLEVPRKGPKRQRKKKFHVAGRRHAIKEDQDGIHTFERRSNSRTFRDEKAAFSDRSPKCFSLNKNKSKEISVQLGVQDLDEFSVRELSCAAKHASNSARLKREKAKRLFSKADLAIQLAASALMTADAVKATSCPSD